MTETQPSPTTQLASLLTVRGCVQGVGFRPFVFRLANELGVGGFVRNDLRGVSIWAEGADTQLNAFSSRLSRDAPLNARIDSIATEARPAIGTRCFVISASEEARTGFTELPLDSAPCVACLEEFCDPGSRRFEYPFISCCDCGPRYTIIYDLPFDRARTSMARFVPCAACLAEYADSGNRRFHAETIACPDCGPKARYVNRVGTVLGEGADALRAASSALAHGAIVAVKGIGGFQLMADATNEAAVARLRVGKHRPSKPLALMVRDVARARDLCVVDAAEEALLTSTAAPIVILRARSGARPMIAPSISAGNATLGIMLPASPLHYLLARETGRPLVATSGNVASEPLCFEDAVARERLAFAADAFLLHDRLITNPIDDAVVRIACGRPTVIRLGRGLAPFSLRRPMAPAADQVALGGHEKASIVLATNDRYVVGPFIGDLDSAAATERYDKALTTLPSLYSCAPAAFALDRHPDYHTTAVADRLELPRLEVQHHHAHILSCMAEHGLEGTVLGIAWDGTGFGDDGTVWGGESLIVEGTRAERCMSLRSFPLPGGESAVRDPRRTWFALLTELGVPKDMLSAHIGSLLSSPEQDTLATMLSQRLNSPRTSSVGRLFDGIAVALGYEGRVTYDGQAATYLENLAAEAEDDGVTYPLTLRVEGQHLALDWALMLRLLLDERHTQPASVVARRFHESLAQWLAIVAQRMGLERVVLSGGVFQNRILLESAVRRLERGGFEVFWHQRVPTNDGGLALGQAHYATLAAAGR